MPTPVSEFKELQAAKSKADRDLARLRAQLATRDALLKRMRAEQQWAAEALASVHVPLLAFTEEGGLCWSNLAAQRLLGLTDDLARMTTETLPAPLEASMEGCFLDTNKHRELPAQLTVKLHGQTYRINLQYLADGSANTALKDTGLMAFGPAWVMSLVPELSDALSADRPYPELPESRLGKDSSGSLGLSIDLGDSLLDLQMQPVIGLQQFLGTEQLAKLEHQQTPSPALDIQLLSALADKMISDRLGALRAGVWMLRLSTDALHERGFAQRVIQTLDSYQMDGSRFVFGLPEDEVMDALVLLKQLQQDLAFKNVRWALLDTSSDLTNFEYLASLGLDFYCLNADIVAQASEDRRAEKVLQALCDAAAAQGMATLATGVDTSEIMTTVRSVGIDYACGEWASELMQGR